MQEQSNVAQPVYRMNLNQDPQQLKEGEVSFALNAVAHSSYYRNARANQPNTLLPAGFDIMGEAIVNSVTKVLFLVNPFTNVSQIGLFIDTYYETKISSALLNFSLAHQIQAKAKVRYDGHIIVYFTDFNNDMRCVDLNNIPLIGGDIDLDAISLFQNYTIPDYRVSEVTGNGSLLSGSYFLTCQYADANGNPMSAWFTPVGPVPIVKDSITQSPDILDGIISNQGTDKAIKMSLFNVDQSYAYLNVGFIKLAEGVYRGFKVATIPTNATEYTFNGAGNVPEELPLAEMTEPVVAYRRAKTVEITDDVLMWGNLESARTLNLQPYFNNVQVQWQVDRGLSSDNLTSHANPVNSTYKKTFRFGERVILGIVLRYRNGSKSQVYIIPGRRADYDSAGNHILRNVDQFGDFVVAGSWDTMMLDDINEDMSSVDEIGQQRWRMYNTAYVLATTTNTLGPADFGEMGYYESTDTYPNDPRVWGTLAGQPVRLHQMPDNTVVPLFKEGDGNPEQAVHLNYLGIRMPNIENVLDSLPANVRSLIQGWEIVVGDRSFNKHVLASGLLYNTFFNDWKAKYVGTNDFRLYNNYPFNDLRPDPYHYKAPGILTEMGPLTPLHPELYNDQIKRDVFTFLSPDTSFRKPYMNEGNLRVHGTMHGLARGYYCYVFPYPRFDDSGSSSSDYSAQMSVGVGWYNRFVKTVKGKVKRSVKEATYVPAFLQVATGNIGMPFHNLMSESTVVMGLRSVLGDPAIVDVSRETFGSNNTDNPVTEQLYIPGNFNERVMSSHYASYTRPITNQYGSIHNIKWNYTNFNNYNVANNTVVFGGDTFLGRFTAKKQHVFFQNAQAYKNWPDDSHGIDLRNSMNIPHTVFYADIREDDHARNNGHLLHYTDDHVGMLPMIVMGVPVFFTESSDNMIYRLNGGSEWETFYRNLQNGAIELTKWLGIEYIDKDNYFVVNDDLSTNNDITFYENSNPFFNPDIDVNRDFYGRSIYSLPSAAEDMFDNWRVYLPRNYYDFPKNEGAIWDIRDIGNYRTLFRLEHGLFMDQLYTVIETNEEGINLGSGKMFQKKPQKLITADNRYSGTHAQWAFSNTPFGAFMVDGDRGHAFVMGSSLTCITAGNDDEWFKANLPLKLSRQIPSYNNADNPANPDSIGYTCVWDGKYEQWILTKRDFELVNPADANKYLYVDGQLYFQDDNIGVLPVQPRIPVPGTTPRVVLPVPVPAEPVLSCPTVPAGEDPYVLNSLGKCVRKIVRAPQPPSGGATVADTVRVKNEQWNNGGGRVYAAGFPVTGEGIIEAYLTTPHLFVNGEFPYDADGRTDYYGRMNSAAVWVAGDGQHPFEEWVGFSHKIENDTNEVMRVYVAMCADNIFKFSLNGHVLVSLYDRPDNTDGDLDGSANFNYVNLYPVDLQPLSVNYIEMVARNVVSVAGFVAEIYENTLEELQGAEDETDLNILFSTANQEKFQVGTSVGWHCDDEGFNLDETDGQFTCVFIDQVDPEETEVTVVPPIGAKVSVMDPERFINRSFTIAYSPANQGWTHFASYLPNYYLAIENKYYSRMNKSGDDNIYSHDSLYNHIYYGKPFPHIIDFVIKNNAMVSFNNLWFQFITKAFMDKGDNRIAEQKYVTYNKAIVYNSLQCSGLLELIVQDELKLSTLFTSLKRTATSRKVGLRKTAGAFAFSQIYDLVNSEIGRDGFFTNRWPLLQSEYYMDKVLDSTLLDYKRDYKEAAEIKELYTQLRLILDDRNDVDLTTYLSGRLSKVSVT